MPFDKEKCSLLNCPACGFYHAVDAAAKPICPECQGKMDLATGTMDEIEELRLDLDKKSCFMRGFDETQRTK